MSIRKRMVIGGVVGAVAGGLMTLGAFNLVEWITKTATNPTGRWCTFWRKLWLRLMYCDPKSSPEPCGYDCGTSTSPNDICLTCWHKMADAEIERPGCHHYYTFSELSATYMHIETKCAKCLKVLETECTRTNCYCTLKGHTS